jgi:hypothetical protein
MKAYVNFLEEKVTRMEALLKQVCQHVPAIFHVQALTQSSQYCPEEEIAKEMGRKFDQKVRDRTSRIKSPNHLLHPIDTGTRLFTISSTLDTTSSTPEEDEYSPSDDEDLKGIYCSLQQLKLDPDYPRFYGRSSGAKLVQTALALRKDVTGIDPPSLKHILQKMRIERPEVWFLHPVSSLYLSRVSGLNTYAVGTQRAQQGASKQPFCIS